MTIRRFRRKVRCLLRYGPHGCPHIERHSRRPKRTSAAQETWRLGRVQDPADLLNPPSDVAPRGRHTRT